MDTPNINIFLAFGAGLLSFLTPCTLPIYPSFLSYVTGVSIDDISAGSRQARAKVLQHSLAFLAGFSSIYVAMGLTASALASFFVSGRCWVKIGSYCFGLPTLGGIFVALMGLALMGVLRIPFLMRDRRFQFSSKPQGYLGSALVGMTFAAGWTPCMGPILGAVLALAASSPGYGGLLLLVYCIGFAIPFLLLAYALGSVRILARYSLWVERIGGTLMVIMGVMLATGYMKTLSAWLFAISPFKGF